MIRQTGCRGVMIGRWALADPWIFRDTWSCLTTGSVPPEPTLEERVALMRRHFHMLVEHRDERSASLDFRKRVGWYARRLPAGRMLRDGGREISAAAEFDALLDEFLASRAGE